MPSLRKSPVDTKVTEERFGTATLHDLIAADANGLSQKLQEHRLKLFPPKAEKTLRRFSSTEAAKIIGGSGQLPAAAFHRREGTIAGNDSAWPPVLLLC